VEELLGLSTRPSLRSGLRLSGADFIMTGISDRAAVEAMDAEDPLRPMRDVCSCRRVIYLDGNSLGAAACAFDELRKAGPRMAQDVTAPGIRWMVRHPVSLRQLGG